MNQNYETRLIKLSNNVTEQLERYSEKHHGEIDWIKLQGSIAYLLGYISVIPEIREDD